VLTLGHASADFNIPVKVLGTTPTLTIGDAGAEDTKIVFDGNAQDFYIALDDSADDLLIGKGSTVGTTPAISIDSDLKVNIPVTTASTSASTGSLITGGGMGVGADLYVGDDTYLITDSAVLGFGADKDTTLTHTDGTGLTLNSTNKLCFNDASQFIQGASATVLDIAATDEIELTATLIDVVGNFTNSGTIVSAGVITAPSLVLGSTAVTTTPAELNLIDGGTSRGTTAVASGDGILINDAGTMAMTNVDTVSTYFASHNVGGGNIVTTGALDSGSITSGFGAIDNGTSGIRTNTFTAETSIVPDASGGADIGTTSLEWGDIFIADDKAIKFGSGQDVSMEYDEDGTDSLLISGGDVTIADDKKLYFGTGQDVYLEYDEDGTDKLIIKGNTTFLDGAYDFDIASHDTSTGLKLGGTLVSATAAELNYSDLATLGTSAASKVLSADSNNLTAISGGVYLVEDTLSFDATQDWDVRASPVAKVTLTANVTFDAPSNPTTGQYISIVCIQDGTGSRTIAWNAVFEFASDTAPTATTTASLGDLFTFRYNGSKWLEVGRNLALTLS